MGDLDLGGFPPQAQPQIPKLPREGLTMTKGQRREPALYAKATALTQG